LLCFVPRNRASLTRTGFIRGYCVLETVIANVMQWSEAISWRMLDDGLVEFLMNFCVGWVSLLWEVAGCLERLLCFMPHSQGQYFLWGFVFIH